MYAIRVYRKPRKDTPVLEMILCKGCVTPKLCRKSGQCDVNDEIDQNKKNLIEKLDGTEKEKNIKVKSSTNKS